MARGSPSSALSALLACVAGVASSWLLYSALFRRRQGGDSGSRSWRVAWRRAPMASSASSSSGGDSASEEEEVPEEFVDPITLAPIQDPVLLCGTGQVYCLTSLRSWLTTGSRTCPKTNMSLRDMELVRLPAVRSRLAAWRQQQGLPPLPPLDPPAEALREADRRAPGLLANLRCGDVYKRGLAAGQVNDLLIEWNREGLTPARQQVVEAMLLDLVWLMRQGDPYGSGVAAAALAQCEGRPQLMLLAAVAVVPAVSLLWSPHAYGQHSAARLLANLARASDRVPDILVEAGAVRGLLRQLDLREHFPYHRGSAAVALAGISQCEAGRQEVRAGDGIRLLKALLLQPEPYNDPVEEREHLVRYCKRDAADCLLALHLSAPEATAAPAVPMARILMYAYCSHAWLLGQADQPNEGYTAAEGAAGLPLRAAGGLGRA